jgi:hypothetical protein
MKLIGIGCLAVLFLTQNVYGGLKQLIEQNVRDASQSYEQIMIETEAQRETPRLWFHVHNMDQQGAVAGISSWLKNIKLDGRAIDVKPVQIVDNGPSTSQLRFFKEQDKSEAGQLKQALQKVIPNLRLIDLSQQYGHLTWIKTGHYELWLGLDVTKLETP